MSSDKKKDNEGTQGSLAGIADELVLAATKITRDADNEEELRIGFEKVLDPIRESIGITDKARYERFGTKQKAAVYRGRPDAVHGQLIIEYEPPGAFAIASKLKHAQQQVFDYLSAAAMEKDKVSVEKLRRLVGVGFDGSQIFFVKYLGNGKQHKHGGEEIEFGVAGPFHFDASSARTFLKHLRALSRQPLTPEHLAKKFGPESDIAREAVQAFAQALEHYGEKRVRVYFEEWKRLFGIVYGEGFTAQRQEEATKLAEWYGVTKETDFQELLFSVHTYFALLMKLIAAELLNLSEGEYSSSYSVRLAHAQGDRELKNQLSEIEDGGIYSKRGVTNFLEGDFFRWYLSAFSPGVKDAVREIAAALSDFEPATPTVEPEATRDLLKRLYQYLVPQEVRHNLGEYYTPDWLAELVLDEVGYDGSTLKRVLDPACGSGTFLVLAIQRARSYGKKNNEPPLETAKRIAANIWGFDLNPLAVIAARTNYLFALGDLVHELSQLEIPVYLADSVLWPRQTQQGQLNLAGGSSVSVKTSVREFDVPVIWVEGKGFRMSEAAPLVEDMTRSGYSAAEAMKRFAQVGLVFPPHEKVVEAFYSQVLELEQQGKNGIWARFLKNVFAPLVAGRFDYVVGNPPWIRWDYLSEEYRKATLSLWKRYGLFSLSGFQARLGGGKKEFAMLFTYASIDYYLKDKAKLGFLITQEVFKSKGAGEGFRKFRLGEGKPFKVLKAHDLVTVQPFEGAANKTAALVVRKNEVTTYPVPYYEWKRKRGIGRIPSDILLDEARKMLVKKRLVAKSLAGSTGSWQTVATNREEILKIGGANSYMAHAGADPQPYGVFLLDVLKVMSSGDLLVKNLPDLGKQKNIQAKEVRIEKELVYPAVRGSDVSRWDANAHVYLLMVQDPMTRKPFPESMMKEKWPRTLAYLLDFKEVLLARASKSLRELAEKTDFYAMFGIGPYTKAPYKVVWQRMSTDIKGAVTSTVKTDFGHKLAIPTTTTAFFPCDNEDEAHYLCALVNSSPVREFIRSYSSAGRGFGTPSVMQHIGIPTYNPNNEVHKKLSENSKELHERASRGDDNLSELEGYNDKLVKELFGLAR